MTKKIEYFCTGCGKYFDEISDSFVCPACGSTVRVSFKKLHNPAPKDIVFEDFLNITNPLENPSTQISMGEGNTPFIELPFISEDLQIRRLTAKLEYQNPTGSFKDRGSSMLVSYLKENGHTSIIEDSSGNAGASIAAYAAKAGIHSIVFVPSTTSRIKTRQLELYGAEVRLTDGPRDNSAIAAVEESKKGDSFYASHNLNPFFMEGTKSFAHEIYKYFNNELPDQLLLPVGNGSFFIGIWKGFEELAWAYPNTFKKPLLNSVQSTTIQPITSSINNSSWIPDTSKATVASGIAVFNPPRKHEIEQITSVNQGQSVAIEDSEMERWQQILGSKEGIYCEVTSASPFAALEYLVKNNMVDRDQHFLIPITGSGLKDPIN